MNSSTNSVTKVVIINKFEMAKVQQNEFWCKLQVSKVTVFYFWSHKNKLVEINIYANKSKNLSVKVNFCLRTRSTRPIDAKRWKRLCLWIMFNIKISLYQTPPHQRFKIFQTFWNLKPEILSNWYFWIIWYLCERILIFSIFILK